MCVDVVKLLVECFFYLDVVIVFVWIVREEGVKVFGRGLFVNIVRSVFMSELSILDNVCKLFVDFE